MEYGLKELYCVNFIEIKQNFEKIINSNRYIDSDFNLLTSLKKFRYFDEINKPTFRSSLIDTIYKMKSRYIFDEIHYENRNYNTSYTSYTAYGSYSSYRSYSSYNSYFSQHYFTTDSNFTFKNKNLGYPKFDFINNNKYKNLLQIQLSNIDEANFVTGYGLELI